MPFPVTKRYFLDFRNSDTGLAPTFTFFQQTPGFGATTPASPAGGIIEKSNGRYYFDWIWLTKTDSDIVFQVDGGASIPTEEVRYIKGTISPKDAFLDEPISQVVSDVWTDNTAYAAGQKGKRVDDIGAPADTSANATVFGKTLLYKESIKGVDDVDLTEIAGTGFATGTDSLKVISDTLDLVKAKTDNLPVDPADASDVALAVTNAVTSIKGGSNIDNTQLNTISGQIKAKTDNLPTDPADASDVAAAVTAARDVITGSPAIDLRSMAGAGFVSGTDSLQAISAASGGLTAGQVAVAVWDALLASHTVANSFGAKIATLALSSDVSSAVTTIQGAGGPTLGQMAGAGFNSSTDSMVVTSDNLLRALGMLHENSVLDQTTFTVDNNLLTGRMRLYDSKANADAAVAASPGVYDTGKIAEYAIVATYTGTNLKTYKVSKE